MVAQSVKRWTAVATAVILLLSVHTAHAANPVDVPIITGELEVHIKPFATIPDDNGKPPRVNVLTSQGSDLYVGTETGGKIYRIRNGDVSLYFDVKAAIAASTDRQLDTTNGMHGGLRGLAFTTTYDRTGLFYVSVMETRPSSTTGHVYLSDVSNPIAADSVLIEFRYDLAADKVVEDSYREPVYDHPIKQIAFLGLDLYIAHGDGSVQSATAGGGMKNDALGKILRINPNKNGAKSYSVPSDNPFIGDSSMIDEAFAIGFRNPHTFCFSNSGELFQGEAGRDNVEEVNLVKKGQNYGWPEREGTFVHLAKGGLVEGVTPLPGDDAKNGYTYPVAQVGHEGSVGDGFVGQALAGGCPIENGSPLDGYYLYSSFPKSGDLYYSKLGEMRSAKTTGSSLTQARTGMANVVFGGKAFKNLGDVVKSAPSYDGSGRADIRFGRGPGGETYVLNKRNGIVYLVTSSEKGGPGGPI